MYAAPDRGELGQFEDEIDNALEHPEEEDRDEDKDEPSNDDGGGGGEED